MMKGKGMRDTFNNKLYSGSLRSAGEEYSDILKAVASLMTKMEKIM
jgi:hypothetical protein